MVSDGDGLPNELAPDRAASLLGAWAHMITGNYEWLWKVLIAGYLHAKRTFSCISSEPACAVSRRIGHLCFFFHRNEQNIPIFCVGEACPLHVMFHQRNRVLLGCVANIELGFEDLQLSVYDASNKHSTPLVNFHLLLQ